MGSRIRLVTVPTALIVTLGAALTLGVGVAQAKRTTITVLDGWGAGPWFGPMYKEWTDAFEARNPDIKLKVIPLGGANWFEKLTAMVASGTDLDVALASATDLAFKNLLVDLRPLHSADPDSRNRKYYPACVDLTDIKLNGKPFMWAVPGNPGTQPLFCNLAIFDRAGVRFDPRAQWTFDDFLGNAKKLTRDDNGDGKPETWGAAVGGGHISGAYNYILNFGGEAYKVDPATGFVTGSAMDSTESIAAFDWLQKLITAHKVSSASGGDFEGGKLAMQQTWWFYRSATSKAKFKYDMMMPPVSPDRKPLYQVVGTQMGSILRSSKHPKEAWKFLKFATSDEGDWIRIKYMPHMPVLRDSDNIAKWKATFPDLSLDEFVRVAKEGNLVSWYRIKYGQARVEEIYSAEVAKLWANKVSAAEFAKRVTDQVNRVITTLNKGK